MFKAICVTRDDDGFACALTELDDGALPAVAQGAVTIAMQHPPRNDKDGPAITDKAPMVRKWPMVAGMDGAGIGAAGEPPEFVRGDRVLRNGYGVGETHRGRLAQKARLSGDGLILVPAALSPRSRSSTIASSAELPAGRLRGRVGVDVHA